MPRYRKKPIVVEAFQMTEDNWIGNRGWPEWLHDAKLPNCHNIGASHFRDGAIRVWDRMRELCVDFDDYIVRHENGDLTSLKPDIFEATYETVEGGE